MPDDPILDESPKVEAPPVVAAPAGVSKDEVVQMVTSALEPVTRTINQLAGAIPRQEQVHQAPPVIDDEETFAQEFYKAPRATLAKFIEAAARPIVAQTADLTSSMYIEQERAKIEDKFGPGTYDAVFAKDLDPVFETLRQTDPGQLTNRRAVENAFKTVTGKNLDALVERMTAHKKAVSDAEITQKNQFRDSVTAELGNLTGGFRRSDKPMLTDEHKAIMTEMRRSTGETLNTDRMAALVNMQGRTLDDYKATIKGLPKGA